MILLLNIIFYLQGCISQFFGTCRSPLSWAIALGIILLHFLLNLRDFAESQLSHFGVLAEDVRVHLAHGFLVQLVRLVQLVLQFLERVFIHFLSKSAYLSLINHRQGVLLKDGLVSFSRISMLFVVLCGYHRIYSFFSWEITILLCKLSMYDSQELASLGFALVFLIIRLLQ